MSERELISDRANQPRRAEQTGQRGDSNPADLDFTFGSDDMQLAQAFIQIEPGVYSGQDLCADGQADGGLTALRLLLDDYDAWTLNASLPILSSYRRCSKRRISGH